MLKRAALLLLSLISLVCTAQQQGSVLKYVIQGQDTVFVDEIRPARIHPKSYMNKREWIQYYKRVHNFSKSYPYALFVAKTIKETDSVFAARNYNKKEEEVYLNAMKDALLDNFEPVFKQLTLSQGLMMIRLIDREVGMAPYYIIQKYLGNVNAGFWQGVAKMLKGDIKREYEPDGEDRDLEELVKYWNNGDFDDLYEFIFDKPRPEIVIPEVFQKPFYLTVDQEKGRRLKKLAKRKK